MSASTRLIRDLQQLDPTELDKVIRAAIAMRSSRIGDTLELAETELLSRIHKSLPDEFQREYDQLVKKRRQDELDEKDSRRYVEMTEELQQLELERLETIAALAVKRGVTLKEIREELGIDPPDV